MLQGTFRRLTLSVAQGLHYAVYKDKEIGYLE